MFLISPRHPAGIRRGFILRKGPVGLFFALLLIGMVVFFAVLIGRDAERQRQLEEMNSMGDLRLLTGVYVHLCEKDAGAAGPGPSIHEVDAVENVSEFAAKLSEYPALNRARLWFCGADYYRKIRSFYFPEPVNEHEDGPHILGFHYGVGITREPDRLFMNQHPKSYAVAVGIPSGVKEKSRYPVMWTRGLSGMKWIPDSPWEGDGGYIGFLDGHVAYYTGTVDEVTGIGIFTDFTTGRPTSDIRAAIGPTARILEDASAPE